MSNSNYEGGTIIGERSRESRRMSMDLLPWVIRAVLIVVGIVVAIMVGTRKKKYYWGVFVIGITASIMGVILLVVSLITGLSFDMGLFLSAAGVIILITGLVIRNRWEKNR